LRHPSFGVFARTVLTLPYWASGAAKLTDLPGTVAEAGHFGLKPAPLVVAATILIQLGGSLMLILGRVGWLAAGALATFTALATVIAHPF
jgi:transmembrane protein